MNLRMFPVSSNSSRRLRRATASSESYGRQGNPALQSHHAVLSEFSNAYQLMGSPAPRNRYACLSQSDQEMLIRQQAMDKAQQGDLVEAIELFTQLIESNPNSASNFNNRGLLHFRRGQFESSLADYNRALGLNPRLAKVYNNRANCYAAMGNFQAAIADYETAIDLDPTDIRARLNLGITFRQLGLHDLALENFDLTLQFSQFLSTTDTDGIPAALKGHLYAERGRAYHLVGDWNCAIGDYHRALAHLPISDDSSDVSCRLRNQVKGWLNQLLNLLLPESSQ
ncbi:tetratricopeptide repeat protein [Leptolyngbyaceae cyanobacterium JSC-12]|nr:tetratricopeptide repeat protein [Leptolyngbyaceae cyanobacterium JSC-12]